VLEGCLRQRKGPEVRVRIEAYLYNNKTKVTMKVGTYFKVVYKLIMQTNNQALP
jgi:hypothetical protein